MRSIPDIRGAVRERSSLIHCITNPISINQCANAILAVGGRPIMAEHPREVSEITATAGALMPKRSFLMAASGQGQGREAISAVDDPGPGR